MAPKKYQQLKAALLRQEPRALLQLDKRSAPDLSALSQDLNSSDPAL